MEDILHRLFISIVSKKMMDKSIVSYAIHLKNRKAEISQI
jgi:hypothetical protein